ncbi:hypothetical protein VPH35_018606 [Triticum aestivum]
MNGKPKRCYTDLKAKSDGSWRGGIAPGWQRHNNHPRSRQCLNQGRTIAEISFVSPLQKARRCRRGASTGDHPRAPWSYLQSSARQSRRRVAGPVALNYEPCIGPPHLPPAVVAADMATNTGENKSHQGVAADTTQADHLPDPRAVDDTEQHDEAGLEGIY